MGTIGVGSPLLTLVKVAGSGVSNCVDFVTRIPKSKIEIESIIGQVEFLKVRILQIEVLEQLTGESSDVSSADHRLQPFSTTLCEAKKAYVEAQDFCMECEQDQKSRVKRLQWLTNDGKQRQWDKITSKLQQAENSFMHLLNWYVLL
jgi:hypothetical protein